MTRRIALASVLATALSVPSGALVAAPDECLAYRANTEVASCANRYAPGSSSPQARPGPGPAPMRTRQARAGDVAELKTVPVVPVQARVQPPTEPNRPMFDVDRQALTDTIIAGAIGGSALILVALGFWRWGSTLTKACPFCGAKMSRNAHACRRCFRAV